MKYSDLQRIAKIRTTTEKLLSYLERNHITADTILSDESVQWTVTTPLYNIGEQAYFLSEEYRDEHPDIPWAKISGLRHRLVHDYDDTNWTIICDILFRVLPPFLASIQKLTE